MTFSLRSVPFVLLTVALLAGTGCRDVSQPALDDQANPSALFPVEHNGEWGYVTRAGSLAIEPQFDRAHSFVGDRALVRQKDQFGYVDPTGTVVIPPTFADARSFADELAPVRPDSLWGFIDRTGTVVIPPQFHVPSTAPDAFASSIDLNAPDSDSGTTNPDRPTYVPPSPSEPRYFAENRARIRTADGWGYVDREGTTVIPPRFEWAGDFRNGRAPVHLPDGRLGYVRPDGALVWPPGRASP